MGYQQFLFHGAQPDEPIRLDGLEREIARKWEGYQQSRYSWLTRQLPLLITDALTAAQQYSVGTDDGLHAGPRQSQVMPSRVSGWSKL
jgi:hypothetical protein